jgi:hypothetical protein
MIYLKTFENFASEYIERTKNQKEEETYYQNIVDILEKVLRKYNMYDDISYISKSKTSFGQSWYMIFKNGREIRISNHSVTSNQRILDDKYISFINAHEPFDEKRAEEIISYYIKDKNIKIKKEEDRNKRLDEIATKRDDINKRSEKFIETLKSNGKAIFDSGKTYQTLDVIHQKHPDWENICQLEYKNAFRYFYIKDQNGYGVYHIDEDYFDFLVEKGYIK